MATVKPTKPSSTLPTTFGGTKTAYTSSEITSGYEADVEEIIDGGNLNYSLAGIFERLEYLTKICDVLNNIPIGKELTIDSNNRYDYTDNADTKISTMLQTLYPVGSIYIGTQATCPLSTLISGSTWELVAEDKALWTSDGTNANETIAAGLPDIQGEFGRETSGSVVKMGLFNKASGAFSIETESITGIANTSTVTASPDVTFKASDSNSIYGNSETVQPPAYVVNVWRRTA